MHSDWWTTRKLSFAATWVNGRRSVRVIGTFKTMGWAFYVQLAVQMRLPDAARLPESNLQQAGFWTMSCLPTTLACRNRGVGAVP